MWMCVAVFVIAVLALCFASAHKDINASALSVLENMFSDSVDARGQAVVARKVTPFQKKVCAEKHGWRCACGCNKPLDASFEVDHIVPLSRGGANHMSNLQPLRSSCHKLKTSIERAV